MLVARRVERAAFDRGPYRAAGLGSVRAVREPALRRERLDVGEHAAQSVVGLPQRDRTQTRRVDSQPPPGSDTSSRAVVVCRPRWSLSRTSPISWVARPTSAFTSRDFPTPDAPISATVRSPRRQISEPIETRARDRARHHDVEIGGRGAVRPLPRRRLRTGEARSAFDSTTIGIAPLSNARTSSRSSRRRFGPLLSDCTTNTTSTLAATTCGRRARPSPASPRTNAERRGSTAATLPCSSRIQSPVATECPASCVAHGAVRGHHRGPALVDPRRPVPGARRADRARPRRPRTRRPSRAGQRGRPDVSWLPRSAASTRYVSVRSAHDDANLRCRPHAAGRPVGGRGRARPRVLRRSLVQPLRSRPGLADQRACSRSWARASPTRCRSERSGSRAPTAKLACAAVWLPPGAYPRTVAPRPDDQPAGSRRRSCAPVAALAGAVRLLDALDKAHHEIARAALLPRASSAPIPLFQRTGAGTAALQPVLSRCDTEGLSAYLETQKEENLAYYAAPRVRARTEGRSEGRAADLDDAAQAPLDVELIEPGQASTTSATNFCSWRRLRTSYTPSQ